MNPSDPQDTRFDLWASEGTETKSFHECTYAEAASTLERTEGATGSSALQSRPWRVTFIICSSREHSSIVCNRVGNGVRELLEVFKLAADDVIVGTDTIEFNLYTSQRANSHAPTKMLGYDAFSIGDNTSFICWRWHPDLKRLTGITWYANDEGRRQVRYCLDGLLEDARLQAHPLTMALLMLQVETSEMRRWVAMQSANLQPTQIETGYHAYMGGADIDPPLDKMDLVAMSKNVCGIAANVTTSALCLQQLVSLGEFLLDQVNMLSEKLPQQHTTASSQTPDSDLEALATANSILLPAITAAHIRARSLHAEAEAWKHKADILVTTILSLTNQRDQSISIQIAADSRTLAQQATRDSTSMKAIAAVTMCFLPGTFVASLFAMPMFDWEAETLKGAVSGRFWLYWAVTVPLTLVVVGVWLVWTNRGALFDWWKERGGGKGSVPAKFAVRVP